MSERWDICTGRPGRDGKTRWTKIGVMFPAKQGEGFSIKLDALPIANKEGEVWLSAFVPRPDERNGQSAAGGASQGEQRYRENGSGIPQAVGGGYGGHDPDDSIPF